MGRCAKCDTKLTEKSVAKDGGCRNCMAIIIYNLDTMVVDEFGMDVWARILARRYRDQMEAFLERPHGKNQ